MELLFVPADLLHEHIWELAPGHFCFLRLFSVLFIFFCIESTQTKLYNHYYYKIQNIAVEPCI